VKPLTVTLDFLEFPPFIPERGRTCHLPSGPGGAVCAPVAVMVLNPF